LQYLFVILLFTTNYQLMYNKKDLTKLTDKLWQNSDFFSKQPNRKQKYSQKEILRAIIYINNRSKTQAMV